MTPGKGIAVRFGVGSKGNPADALKSPHQLPPVMSPSNAGPKSSFYKNKVAQAHST